MCLISTAKLLRFRALTLVLVRLRTKTLVTRLLCFQRTSRRPQCRMISKSCVCRILYASISPWWSLSGSNRRPPACKAGALPAELRPQGFLGIMVGLGGLEPPASPLSGVRSNHLSYRPRDRAPEPTPACLEANPKRLLLKSPAMDGRFCSSQKGLCVKYRCLVWTSCEESSRPSFLERR